MGTETKPIPEPIVFKHLLTKDTKNSQQMPGSPSWPQIVANQSHANINMSLFVGQMFGQKLRMENHIMDINRQLLAQNNALTKKHLQDQEDANPIKYIKYKSNTP